MLQDHLGSHLEEQSWKNLLLESGLQMEKLSACRQTWNIHLKGSNTSGSWAFSAKKKSLCCVSEKVKHSCMVRVLKEVQILRFRSNCLIFCRVNGSNMLFVEKGTISWMNPWSFMHMSFKHDVKVFIKDYKR